MSDNEDDAIPTASETRAHLDAHLTEELRKGGVGHNPFVPNAWLTGNLTDLQVVSGPHTGDQSAPSNPPPAASQGEQQES